MYGHTASRPGNPGNRGPRSRFLACPYLHLSELPVSISAYRLPTSTAARWLGGGFCESLRATRVSISACRLLLEPPVGRRAGVAFHPGSPSRECDISAYRLLACPCPHIEVKFSKFLGLHRGHDCEKKIRCTQELQASQHPRLR